LKKEKLFKMFSLINEYSLYAILFFIPISKAIPEVFFTFAIISFFGKKIIKPEFKVFRSNYNFFLAIFILFSALSLFNSPPFLAKSLIALIFKWCKFIWLFLFFQDAVTDRRKANKAVVIFVISAALVSIDCIFQKFTGFDFFRHYDLAFMGNGIYAVRAAFNNYNDLAAYLVVSISLIFTLAEYMRGKLKFVLSIFLVTSTIAFLLTFSRGGWIGLLSSLVFILVISKKYRIFAAFFISFLLVVLLTPETRERFMFIFQQGGDANRFINWGIALDMVKQNPLLGTGVGTFIDHFPRDKTWVIIGYAHNCFLQIWAETGIFSLLSFLLFLGTFLYKAIQLFRSTKDYLALGLAAGLFGYIVHSVFDTHFYSLQLSFLFWSVSGLLASLICINRAQESKVP